MKLLVKIVKAKKDTEWTKWRDVCEDFDRNEELIKKLEDSNLIVQRKGFNNQVKLKNVLLEQMIIKFEQ